MKLDVPFFVQSTPLNCGSNALKMVFAFLGEEFDINVLDEKSGIKEGKSLYTVQLAAAAAGLGFRVDFYSIHIDFNEQNLDLEFYKKYSAMTSNDSEFWVNKARESGVKLHEKSVELKKLLSFVTNDSLPIVILDWNVVLNKKEKGYQGHFVPVVGYDEEFVYVHDGGTNNPAPFVPVPRKVFEEARKAEGTDEDILVIHRKK
ncbi:MAG: peptidase C39 family protein [Candidatus Nanoarchaeia archaeon]